MSENVEIGREDATRMSENVENKGEVGRIFDEKCGNGREFSTNTYPENEEATCGNAEKRSENAQTSSEAIENALQNDETEHLAGNIKLHMENPMKRVDSEQSEVPQKASICTQRMVSVGDNISKFTKKKTTKKSPLEKSPPEKSPPERSPPEKSPPEKSPLEKSPFSNVSDKIRSFNEFNKVHRSTVFSRTTSGNADWRVATPPLKNVEKNSENYSKNNEKHVKTNGKYVRCTSQTAPTSEQEIPGTDGQTRWYRDEAIDLQDIIWNGEESEKMSKNICQIEEMVDGEKSEVNCETSENSGGRSESEKGGNSGDKSEICRTRKSAEMISKYESMSSKGGANMPLETLKKSDNAGNVQKIAKMYGKQGGKNSEKIITKNSIPNVLHRHISSRNIGLAEKDEAQHAEDNAAKEKGNYGHTSNTLKKTHSRMQDKKEDNSDNADKISKTHLHRLDQTSTKTEADLFEDIKKNYQNEPYVVICGGYQAGETSEYIYHFRSPLLAALFASPPFSDPNHQQHTDSKFTPTSQQNQPHELNDTEKTQNLEKTQETNEETGEETEVDLPSKKNNDKLNQEKNNQKITKNTQYIHPQNTQNSNLIPTTTSSPVLSPTSTPQNDSKCIFEKLYLLSEPKMNHSVCLTPENGIVVVGGLTGASFSRSGDMWGMALPALQVLRYDAASVCVDGGILVMGGFGSKGVLRECEFYCPRKLNWRVLPPLKLARQHAAAINLGSLVYVIGGTDKRGNQGHFHKSLESINLKKSPKLIWTPRSPMTTARARAAVATHRNRIFVAGGTNGVKVLNSVEIYDPFTDTWKNGPNLNEAKAGACLLVFKETIICLGGIDSKNRGGVDDMEAWKPEGENLTQGSWTVVGSTGFLFTCLQALCLNSDTQNEQLDSDAYDKIHAAGLAPQENGKEGAKGDAGEMPRMVKNLMASDVLAANALPKDKNKISEFNEERIVCSFSLADHPDPLSMESSPDSRKIGKLVSNYEKGKKGNDPMDWWEE